MSVVVILSFAVVCVDIFVLGLRRVHVEALAAMIFLEGVWGDLSAGFVVFGCCLAKKGARACSRGFFDLVSIRCFRIFVVSV